MWEYFNPNPVKAGGVGDCAVRAIAKALGITWEQAYVRLAMNGYLMGDIPNSDLVWGSVLRQEGFHREMIPNTCPDCYTIAQFLEENPSGLFVIKSQDHVATAENGILFDSWDSTMNVPIYYWTNNRKDE